MQVPFELASAVTATVEADNNGSGFSIPAVPVFVSQPGIFEITLDAQGARAAAVIHLDGSLVDPSNPATAGEIVSLFFTGAGPVEPEVATGTAGPVPPPLTVLPTAVQVSDTGARVLFSGYAPQEIGLYQINLEIPSGIVTGPSVELKVKVGDSFSQASSIAVRPLMHHLADPVPSGGTGGVSPPLVPHRHGHPRLGGDAAHLHHHRDGVAGLGSAGNLRVDLHHPGY